MRPQSPHPDATDRVLAALVRERFEQDRRKRIDVAMQQQLALFLAGQESRRALAEAA
jgi:hypothetical protein